MSKNIEMNCKTSATTYEPLYPLTQSSNVSVPDSISSIIYGETVSNKSLQDCLEVIGNEMNGKIKGKIIIGNYIGTGEGTSSPYYNQLIFESMPDFIFIIGNNYSTWLIGNKYGNMSQSDSMPFSNDAGCFTTCVWQDNILNMRCYKRMGAFNSLNAIYYFYAFYVNP